MKRIGLVLGAALLLAVPASAAVITKTATTATYKLTLDVGPLETMYTQAQVDAKHPKTGEVMIDTGMGGMSMGDMKMAAGNRHLEVHIASRVTGKAVSGLMPTISLEDTGGMPMAMSSKVDVVEMEGIGQGMSDLHYGNNVKLTGGHTYKVVVTVKGEKASFTFRA